MGATYYDQAAPGMSRLASAFANTARLRQQGALYGIKNLAEVSKITQEAQKAAFENQRSSEVEPGRQMYGATSAGVSVPEFNQYQQFREQGGLMPTVPQEVVGPQGPQEPTAPRWNADQQTKLANALRSVALMRSSTGHYAPHNVTQAEEEQQRMGATAEALTAARAPDEPGGAAPQGGELVRRIAAAYGHNVLAEKDDRATFEKELDQAGITDPKQRADYWNQYLVKKSTHAPGVQINMPNATHFGTDPDTGKPGMFQIGRDGKRIFTPMGPAPSSNPIQQLIADTLKNNPPGGAAPQNVQAQFAADKAYKGKTLGKEVAGKGWEVYDGKKLVGYVKA